ncbi:ABC transporter permease [Paenibacillus sp. FJAT-26967]|uniref:ABC transporter permease n=1 Tax=Paenibacillus sp. FJAT-26967 TaxID=1729690 RepID=UPI0008391C7E|nr:ABC transporter permease subunit [Paenibacillus sp. FJAT-26967]
MSLYSAEKAVLPHSHASTPSRLWTWQTLLPVLITGASFFVHLGLPDKQPAASNGIYTGLLALFLFIYAALITGGFLRPALGRKLREQAPLVTLVLVLLGIWQLLTQKLDLFPMPYFPSQVKILDALIGEASSLAVSTLYSFRLLATGYIIGTVLGLATGILMGWYHRFRYWVNPFLRVLGPIPSTAWIPIVLVIFPTSFSASVFLIVLAVWFPVTVMTWTGIANVNNSFFEVAKTLGAGESYLIRKVAIPAAFPQIFIGLFMGTGTSFVTLIVAEMLGVKAGLGFYITWAQGWGEYYKVYAALFIMAVLFSGIITLLFKFKDKVLIWQKGLIKW